jgi:hypothetical protein
VVASQVQIIRELDPTILLGPQGVQVAAFIERARTLSRDDIAAIDAARDTDWDAAARGAAEPAAWDTSRDAALAADRGGALGAAFDAIWAAARCAREAVWDAVPALIARELISDAHYYALTVYVRKALGPIHPDDPDIRERSE